MKKIIYILFINIFFSQNIIISEVLASSHFCCSIDSSIFGDDFVEIYNLDSLPVNISEYKISNISGVFELSNDSLEQIIIEPNDYIVLWFDTNPELGALHINSKINGRGDQIMLYNLANIVIDSLSFDAQFEDISLNRDINQLSYFYFNFPTPGFNNNDPIEPVYPTIKINEILASSFTCCDNGYNQMEDYLELYNYGLNPINLAGLTISDNEGDNSAIPYGYEETIILPNSFLTIWLDESAELGPLHSSAAIENFGEIIYIYDKDFITIVDSLDLPYQFKDTAYGRYPDGTDSLYYMPISIGLSNIASPQSIVPDLYINEYLAYSSGCCLDNYDEIEDFVELYNPSNSIINLKGLIISDGTDSGTLIQEDYFIFPNQFQLFWFDKDTTQGINHINSKLSRYGENIYLFDTNNYKIIDQVSFGEQFEDISTGRIPDGSNNWNLIAIPTPGTCNHSDSCNDYLYGDINLDGIVNIIDILLIVQLVLGYETNGAIYLIADVSGDGLVDIVDIIYIVNHILYLSN